MDLPGTETFGEREARRPLYVPVLTRPPLSDCWSLDVSARGMGLVCLLDSQCQPIAEGAQLSVEFTLPDSRATLEAAGDVVWRREAGRGISVGVRFLEVS